jgi:hypothetical protein
VASVNTPTKTFTYLQPCAARPSGTPTNALSGVSISAFAVANDTADGSMFGFNIPVEVGSGAAYSTIRITPSGTMNNYGPSGSIIDVLDFGTATDFTSNGSTTSQIRQQLGISSAQSADVFDSLQRHRLHRRRRVLERKPALQDRQRRKCHAACSEF